MSRSNPQANANPNPATRWHEWNGEKGNVRYYDKVKKENVAVKLPFTFVLLDQLASVQGWHESSQSGIYSNEVRRADQERLTVKAFKAGVLAEGIYKDIKDRVGKLGGKYVQNLYIGFPAAGDTLQLGSLKLKGAALQAWSEFRKTAGNDIYNQAITITGYTEGKKGRVVFRVPTFKLADLAPELNEAALALDQELQAYLTAYFARGTQSAAAAAPQREEEPEEEMAIDG